jgi:hypothetical protein
MGENRRMMPAWSLVGVMVVYVFLVLAPGLFEFLHAPSIVLANVHPAIWWGAATPVSGSIMEVWRLGGSRPSSS